MDPRYNNGHNFHAQYQTLNMDDGRVDQYPHSHQHHHHHHDIHPQEAVKYMNINEDYGYMPYEDYSRDIPVVPVIETNEEDDGPHCTDRPWVIALGGLLLVTFVIVLYSQLHALPARLLTMPNYKGEYCGLDTSVKGQPYLYYPLDPAARAPKLLLHAGQCVSHCPGLKDVGKPMPIPMVQNEFDQANPGASGIVVRYTVHSPMYATDKEAGNLCLPIDKGLKKAVLNAVSTVNVQMRKSLGSLLHAWPAMLRHITLALITFGFVTQVAMSSVPRLSLQLIIIVFILTLITGAAVFLNFGFIEAYALPFQYSSLYSISPLLVKLLGIGTLVSIPLGTLFVLANWGVFWEGVTHHDSLKDVLRDLTGTVVAPIILSIGGTAVIFFTCMIVVHLASISQTFPINGLSNGSLVAPLFQETRHFTPLSVLMMVWIVISTVWLISLFRSTARFCGSYVAVVWYFAPVLNCGCDERDITGTEGIRALQTAFTVSFGTNALYGAIMTMSNPMKYFLGFSSRRKSPHLTPPDNDQLTDSYPTTTPAESSETAQWMAFRMSSLLPSAAAVCDFVHSAALTEVILQGRDLVVGMNVARQRMVTRGPLVRPSVAGRFVGSFGVVGHLIALTMANASALCTFMSVSAKSVFFKVSVDGSPRVEESIGFFAYTMPGSRHFVSNPVVVTVLVFSVTYYICDIFLGFTEGILDAISYCYIVDLHSLCNGPDGSRMAPVEEHPCHVERTPHQFKQLLTRVLEHEIGVDAGQFEGVSSAFIH